MKWGDVNYVDATPDTIGEYGICGYKNQKNKGFQLKLSWLRKRYNEGLRMKVLYSESDGTVGYIEYMPGEYAWRPINANGYLVIHCLFILKKKYKGKGFGMYMVKDCLKEARESGRKGVAVVTSRDTWMAKKNLFLKNAFELVEEAPPHYELLAKRFDERSPLPSFTGNWEQKLKRYNKGLTILYSDQCPYLAKAIEEIPPMARELFGMEPKLIKLMDYSDVKNSPNPFGVFSIILNGELVADHPISATRFGNIMIKKVKK